MADLLEVRGLGRTFQLGGRPVAALDDVSLSLAETRILGVVGESGSGKSTLARLVVGLDRADAGEVRIDGQAIAGLKGAGLRDMRRKVQMVFQDPYGSLDPRQRVGRIVAEPLHLDPAAPRGRARRDMVAGMLDAVGLPDDAIDRFPHEFSGGQRQRIAIARALITRPRLLIADEATSALDLTVQAQILRLILDLRAQYGLAVLFITHNLGVVEEICDEVVVMQAGRVVEAGPVAAVMSAPRQDYTRQLLAAEPRLDRIGRRGREDMTTRG